MNGFSRRRYPENAWIWPATFAKLLVCGCPYFGIPRWQMRDAGFAATTITRACAAIRRER